MNTPIFVEVLGEYGTELIDLNSIETAFTVDGGLCVIRTKGGININTTMKTDKVRDSIREAIIDAIVDESVSKLMQDPDPFVKLPIGDDTHMYIRRSQVLMLEPSDIFDSGETLHGTRISFRLNDHTSTRFIMLSPEEVMRLLDNSE